MLQALPLRLSTELLRPRAATRRGCGAANSHPAFLQQSRWQPGQIWRRIIISCRSRLSPDRGVVGGVTVFALAADANFVYGRRQTSW